MALLRMIYDSVVIMTFYMSGVYMYYQHKNYAYSTHPLTVITCKIGAIIQIILSVSLFFSNYANNFVYIIHMKDVGLQRFLEETTSDIEQRNGEVPDALEDGGNVPVDGAEHEDQAVAANAAADHAQEAVLPNVEEIGHERS